MNDDGDSCSCDVCADVANWHRMSGEQKLAAMTIDHDRRNASYWKGYAEELEAQNYDLERENVGLREELSAALARCPNCGRNK